MIHYQIEVFRRYRSNTQLDEIQKMKSKNVCENVIQEDVPQNDQKGYMIPV